MTEDEACRAWGTARKTVRAGFDGVHARLTRQLDEFDRARDATSEAARQRAQLVRWLGWIEIEQRIIAAIIAEAGDEP
jgi:hypothetical protein